MNLVEVLSPSTRHIDASAKLAGYFRIPAIAHYLILDPDQQLVIHHARGEGAVETRVIRDGAIVLDPPGIELTLGEAFVE